MNPKSRIARLEKTAGTSRRHAIKFIQVLSPELPEPIPPDTLVQVFRESFDGEPVCCPYGEIERRFSGEGEPFGVSLLFVEPT